jgi:RNA polymerase sigma factor (sigma-70 family)
MKNNISGLSQFRVSWYNKQKYTEDDILDGIINNTDKVIMYMYKSYFHQIKAMVFSFHSTVLDAEDIFQDGLVAAIFNVKEKRFNGDCSFRTYLTSICRNICLKQLMRPKEIPDSEMVPSFPDQPDDDVEELIGRLMFLKEKMNENCRQIIDLRFGLVKSNIDMNEMLDSSSNVRFEELANYLNIKPANARQRFKRCLEELRKIVFNDKAWKEILTATY